MEPFSILSWIIQVRILKVFLFPFGKRFTYINSCDDIVILGHMEPVPYMSYRVGFGEYAHLVLRETSDLTLAWQTTQTFCTCNSPLIKCRYSLIHSYLKVCYPRKRKSHLGPNQQHSRHFALSQLLMFLLARIDQLSYIPATINWSFPM